jgi:uncharacterized membrane protein (DUF4010 family)
MDEATRVLFERLGIALMLGLLVGLQRQHVESPIAGLRTFPLITVLGLLAATLDAQQEVGGGVLAGVVLAFGGLVAAAYVVQHCGEHADAGLTTEITALVMFAVGAYLADGAPVAAVAIAAGTAVLLQFKGELHGLVRRLGPDDLRAIMTFVLITGVVLPVLPNEDYGPFGVFNPFDTWRMVVIMVGLSLGGYLSYRFLGKNAGVLLGGILGGAISSTATTFSFSRQVAKDRSLAGTAALIIMLASTMVYVRLLVEIAAVAPNQLWTLGPPLAVLFGISAATSVVAWFRLRREPVEMAEHTNPTELMSAIIFATIYVGVSLALAAAKEYSSQAGIYATALLSGLTDLDAITLSTARMVQREDGGIAADQGWRIIVIATLANLAFKTGIAATLGGRALLHRTVLLFAIPVVASILLFLFWPHAASPAG